MASKLHFGDSVKIMGGMAEFVGKTGYVVGEEGSRPTMYRVRLHHPVNIDGVGVVSDDLWERSLLRKTR